MQGSGLEKGVSVMKLHNQEVIDAKASTALSNDRVDIVVPVPKYSK